MLREQLQNRIRNTVLLCGFAFLAACASRASHEEVLVFAAASLTESFQELEEAFEELNPGVDLVLNIASSTTLRTQILDGASADIFASANLAHMRSLVDAGLVSAEGASVFATNELLLVLAPDNAAGITKIEELARPGLRLVLALPEVPAGDYARQAITALDMQFGPGFEEAVLNNLVSNEDNVRQVLLKVALGEADAGLVYRTDALASPELGIIPIPQNSRPEVIYTIAVLDEAVNSDGANAFLTFLFSDQGQAILHSWGFQPADSQEAIGKSID